MEGNLLMSKKWGKVCAGRFQPLEGRCETGLHACTITGEFTARHTGPSASERLCVGLQSEISKFQNDTLSLGRYLRHFRWSQSFANGTIRFRMKNAYDRAVSKQMKFSNLVRFYK